MSTVEVGTEWRNKLFREMTLKEIAAANAARAAAAAIKPHCKTCKCHK